MKLCPACNSQIQDNQEVPELVPLGYHEDALVLSIKRRIAAEEKLRWIPVSERLPDEDVASVLIYTKEGGVAEGQYYPTINAWKQFRWSVEDSNVTHWMTLPNPPQEVE